MAPDQRCVGCGIDVTEGRVREGTDASGTNRQSLPLDLERLELDRFEPPSTRGDQSLAGEDLARFGTAHQPGGEVGGVAHDDVGAPLGMPHVAHEHDAQVGADPQGEG